MVINSHNLHKCEQQQKGNHSGLNGMTILEGSIQQGNQSDFLLLYK